MNPQNDTAPGGGKSSYTPGPWDDTSAYPEYQSVRVFAGRHYVASVGNSDDAKEQTVANARLISAAPELLNGLQHMRWCSSCAQGSWEDCENGRAALAAIAKATGTDQP